MSTPIIPVVVTAPIGNMLRALGHGTKAVEIFSSMLEDSATATKEITALSLGAKTTELKKQLAANQRKSATK